MLYNEKTMAIEDKEVLELEALQEELDTELDTLRYDEIKVTKAMEEVGRTMKRIDELKEKISVLTPTQYPL